MESTATNASVTPKSIIARVNDFLTRNRISKAEVANEINYSRTTVSRYLSGNYNNESPDLEKALEDYLTSKGANVIDGVFAQKTESSVAGKLAFFEYKDSKSVLGVCSSCQEFMGLGIVVGKSGFGKTHTLKYYANMPRVAYVECDDTMASRDMVEAIEKALGIPGGYGTIWKRVNGIRDFFNVNHGYLLIIDEADKLISKYTTKKMEILRAIFDQADVGMVIAGEPKLESQIKGYLARFANRVDFYASLKGLTKADVEEYMAEFELDPDALNDLTMRACNAQTGCFRLLDRTLNNVIRIMRENAKDRVTVEIINQASNMMMP